MRKASEKQGFVEAPSTSIFSMAVAGFFGNAPISASEQKRRIHDDSKPWPAERTAYVRWMVAAPDHGQANRWSI
jgi:hypothetical protein